MPQPQPMFINEGETSLEGCLDIKTDDVMAYSHKYDTKNLGGAV